MKKTLLIILLLLSACSEKEKQYTFSVVDKQGKNHKLSFYENDIEKLGNFDKAYENVFLTKDNSLDYFEIIEKDVYQVIVNNDTGDFKISDDKIGTSYSLVARDNRIVFDSILYYGYNAPNSPYNHSLPQFIFHIKGSTDYSYYDINNNLISKGKEVVDKEVIVMPYTNDSYNTDVLYNKKIEKERILADYGMGNVKEEFLYSETKLDSIELIDVVDGLEVTLFDGNLIKWYQGNDGIIYCPLFKNDNLYGVIYYFDLDDDINKYNLAIRREIDKQNMPIYTNCSLNSIIIGLLSFSK